MILTKDQRVVILMIDGFDIDYFNKTEIPAIKKMASAGICKSGKGIFPSLTNANNISIACGAWPETHGVTTNCYFDESTGKAAFLEDHRFLCAPTIFDQAGKQGRLSALLTCKSKTTKILGTNLALSLASEDPPEVFVRRYGQAPPMYSADINYWLCEVACDILLNRPEIGLMYLHTTDYPMHMWPPEAVESRNHLSCLDDYIARMHGSAPDALFILTADHGMNYKKRCWDLAKACSNRGLPLKFAVSPVADRLLKHHLGFGGVSYVYLNRPVDAARAIDIIGSLPGVEAVLDRETAAKRFRLMASRIGDLVVIPDIDTVFGDLPDETETLDASYRSHGSLYETDIPLLFFNPEGNYPDPNELNFNLDLTRVIFQQEVQ